MLVTRVRHCLPTTTQKSWSKVVPFWIIHDLGVLILSKICWVNNIGINHRKLNCTNIYNPCQCIFWKWSNTCPSCSRLKTIYYMNVNHIIKDLLNKGDLRKYKIYLIRKGELLADTTWTLNEYLETLIIFNVFNGFTERLLDEIPPFLYVSKILCYICACNRDFLCKFD